MLLYIVFIYQKMIVVSIFVQKGSFFRRKRMKNQQFSRGVHRREERYRRSFLILIPLLQNWSLGQFPQK